MALVPLSSYATVFGTALPDWLLYSFGGLASSASDVCATKAVDLSTDRHSVVCTLKALKPLINRKTFRPQKTYPIKKESLADKEVRTAFAHNLASTFKNFRPLLKILKLSGFKQQSFIASANNCCGLKRVGGTKSREKKTRRLNQEVKEAVRAKKKWPVRSDLQINHQLNSVRNTLEHVRQQPQKLTAERKRPGKNSEKSWTIISKWQTKNFGKSFAVCVEKDLKPLS